MMSPALVVMGVAGCGKSSLGAELARSGGADLIEGDAFHSVANLDKMRRGIPLTDADRADWLAALAEQLRARSGNTVLTCSALKRAYRETLRAAAPGLRFVFMQIDAAAARARVEARQDAHFFSSTLVESQFAALEPPVGEPGVLQVDALAPLPRLRAEVHAWLQEPAA